MTSSFRVLTPRNHLEPAPRGNPHNKHAERDQRVPLTERSGRFLGMVGGTEAPSSSSSTSICSG